MIMRSKILTIIAIISLFSCEIEKIEENPKKEDNPVVMVEGEKDKPKPKPKKVYKSKFEPLYDTYKEIVLFRLREKAKKDNITNKEIELRMDSYEAMFKDLEIINNFDNELIKFTENLAEQSIISVDSTGSKYIIRLK